MTDTTNSSPAPRATLSAEINAATRSSHTHLNRLITSRLPLALPAHASTPNLYALGIHHFAHIYLTFESVWTDLCAHLHSPTALSSLLDDPWISVPTGENQNQTPQNLEVLKLLATLLPPGLHRAKRLRADLAVLGRLSPVDLDVKLAHFPSEAVRDFCLHIREAASAKPHILLAYAWVMYMAIFSGGRWIRAQLLSAPPEFWFPGSSSDDDETLKQLSTAGLSLWFFPGAQDGEDIKAEFKHRLSVADTLLTAEQRGDVLAEAGEIFERCTRLVEELDGLLDTPMEGLPVNARRRGYKSPATAESSPEDAQSRKYKRPATVEPQLEKEAEKQDPASASADVSFGMRIKQHHEGQDANWFKMPGIAGLALVVSCVSWYAMYHAGTWAP